MVYYKVLSEDGRSHDGGSARWPLPHKDNNGLWIPGDWMPSVPCKSGYHLYEDSLVIAQLGPMVFEAEYRGELLREPDGIVVQEARLTRLCEGWTPRTARLFACDCAEHTLHIYEVPFPSDGRPRGTIETARRYAVGQATRRELAVARADADAAGEAAWDTGWTDADVVGAAEAAWAATWSADAGEGARAAVGAAWASAIAAGEAVEVTVGAGDTIWEAARAAAWSSERRWQWQKLQPLLEM